MRDRLGWIRFLSSLAFLLGLAVPVGAAGGEPCDDCQKLKDWCLTATDGEIDTVSYLWPSDSPYKRLTKLGTCYWHDRLACPGCGYYGYVKNSQNPPPSGLHGGTGHVDSVEEAMALLRAACIAGECCCRPVPPGVPKVYARNSISGSCCAFEAIEPFPPGWTPLPFREFDCPQDLPTLP